jgi:hypothetical protein
MPRPRRSGVVRAQHPHVQIASVWQEQDHWIGSPFSRVAGLVEVGPRIPLVSFLVSFTCVHRRPGESRRRLSCWSRRG